MCKCEIDPTGIGKFCLKSSSQYKIKERKIDFDLIMVKGRAVISTTNHAYTVRQLMYKFDVLAIA